MSTAESRTIAVASWGSNRLDVFARGTDNQMYHQWYDGSNWGPQKETWEARGGVFSSPPAVASWAANRLDVFAVGTDNQMYYKWWDGSSWNPSPTGWEPLGGVFTSAPAVASWAYTFASTTWNRLDVFGLGTDNQMYHKWWDGSSWNPSLTGWEPRGGTFAAG